MAAVSEPHNPGGNIGMGAVIFKDGVQIDSYSDFKKADWGNSNNVAEYRAFMWLMVRLTHMAYFSMPIKIFGDSKLVICQMSGAWKIKNGRYVETALRCREMIRVFKNIQLEWIPREQNSYADELSKGQLIKNNVQFKIQPI